MRRCSSAAALRAPPPAMTTGRAATASRRTAASICSSGACGQRRRFRESGGRERRSTPTGRRAESPNRRDAGARRASDARHRRRWSRTLSALHAAARHAKDTLRKRALVFQFVQHAPLLAERGAHRCRGDHEQRNGVRVGLRGGRQDVGETGTRDGERGGGAAAQARVAIRGESRPLLMAYQHMAHVLGGEAAVEFEVVNPGDSKYGVDSVGGQQFHEVPPDASRHFRLLERRVGKRARMACGAAKSKQARCR